MSWHFVRALAVSATLIAGFQLSVPAQPAHAQNVAHDAEGNAIVAGAASPEKMRDVMMTAARKVIQPGYSSFAAAGTDLIAATDTLCAQPDEATLERTRNAFTATALAWARVENIRLGPVMSENRLERVLFWPDRKSIGLRQVQALLVEKDDSALKVETLRDKSVALQGLGALEFVLFGTGSDGLAKESGYRCTYAQAVARNLAGIGKELETAWQKPEEVLSVWLRDDDPDRATEMLNELVGALVHGLEATRDIRLRGFLAATPAKDRPRVALFRRSGNTVPMIAADIEGLSELFDKSAMDTLLPDDVRSIAGSIRFEFNQLIDLAGSIDKPVAEALADPDLRQRLVLIDLVIDSLIDRLDTQYAPATGLASGFSFSDGD